MIDAFAAKVAATPFAVWAAESAYAYPWANVVHIFGLVMLLGGIGLVDLRLLGAFRALPLPALSTALTPLAVTGLLLLVASGSILFAADAIGVARSDTFRWKLALIGIALANAAAFRWLYRHPAEAAPAAARLMAAASLFLWVSVAISGRMIAYS